MLLKTLHYQIAVKSYEIEFRRRRRGVYVCTYVPSKTLSLSLLILFSRIGPRPSFRSVIEPRSSPAHRDVTYLSFVPLSPPPRPPLRHPVVTVAPLHYRG